MTAPWEPVDEDDVGPCSNCERCTWGPGEDCGGWTVEWLPDGSKRRVGERHPHCERCGHCVHRHQRRGVDLIIEAYAKAWLADSDKPLLVNNLWPPRKEGR